MGLGNEDGGYYSDLMHYARDVFSPNNTGGSNQVEKSSKENSKLKPVEMKRKKRASAGSIKLQELLTEQNVIQKRALAILESDSPSSTHSHDFSINAAVTLINRMVDDELMTKGRVLWCFAMSLFEDAVKRELFMSLPDDSGRLTWLNYKKDDN